jgi:hypothetical protein
MPCTALGAGSACPHFVNPNCSDRSRRQPRPISCDFGPGSAFLPPPKPRLLLFPSWHALPAPCQARIPDFPVLGCRSGPLPSPYSRISGPGMPFQPPAKPRFPAFRSWGAFPAPCQARIPGFSVLGRLSSPLPSPDSRLFGPGMPSRPSAKPGSPCFPSWDALPGGS